ncbi:ABC transporter permease [Aeromicrobium wangtongii]|uniref:ABC transporter permease n=1 Tax=Aeromicrobium wangtongii TaxID=2969247 RepID=A0ABY5MB41_9ACTN|nr:ABC transporter permease [Aeromicrobium wangtongii]MCD9197854.1 ABC transporter permease [Aeromicrobium wangtongii]MCL3819477.1 ABC transporter permease [Aeromicrobium wangtongii]UUP15335.1 ABC transporter permease [Aeromicrobium wangtongii]
MSAPQSTLDLSPRPGAAPRSAMLRAQTVMELKLQGRNAEQVLLTMVIPLVLLVLGSRADGIVDLGPGRTIDIITPGILALAVLSTSFTSLAIATGFERRYGIIKRLGASPLPRWGLLFGKITAVVIVEIVQLAILSGAGIALGWDPQGGVVAFGEALVLIVLGTAAFGSLGLLIAGTLRAEANLAVANLVYVLLLVGGGLLVPLSRYPEAARHVVELLPSGALGQGLRDAFAGQGAAPFAIVVLLVWTVCASLLVSRTFKWE